MLTSTSLPNSFSISSVLPSSAAFRRSSLRPVKKFAAAFIRCTGEEERQVNWGLLCLIGRTTRAWLVTERERLFEQSSKGEEGKEGHETANQSGWKERDHENKKIVSACLCALRHTDMGRKQRGGLELGLEVVRSPPKGHFRTHFVVTTISRAESERSVRGRGREHRNARSEGQNYEGRRKGSRRKGTTEDSKKKR